MTTGVTERTSKKPLSLGKLYEFFIGAWPLMDVLPMNYQGDLDGMLEFFSGTSAFYAQFDELPRARVRSEFSPVEVEDVDSDQVGSSPPGWDNVKQTISGPDYPIYDSGSTMSSVRRLRPSKATLPASTDGTKSNPGDNDSQSLRFIKSASRARCQSL